MNSKDRRILARAPKKVQEIMDLLPQGWRLGRHGPSPMGWVADLSYKQMKFRLVEDRFYVGVSSMKNDQMKTIEPPSDQRMTISTEQICDLLMKGVEDWDR